MVCIEGPESQTQVRTVKGWKTTDSLGYSNSTRDNFDIYLPNWLAKYNKLIYTSIVLVAVLILLYRLIFQ